MHYIELSLTLAENSRYLSDSKFFLFVQVVRFLTMGRARGSFLNSEGQMYRRRCSRTLEYYFSCVCICVFFFFLIDL